MMKILITRAAWFIGVYLANRLLETSNDEMIGLDNLNDYYAFLKDFRLKILNKYNSFKSFKGDISDKALLITCLMNIALMSLLAKLVAMQKGDVLITYADATDLERDFGYKPSTSLRNGLRKFACWYKKML